LFVKLLIPTLTGFVVYYAPAKWVGRKKSAVHTPQVRSYLSGEVERTAAAAGFFAALLLAWPVISFWDLISVQELREKRVAFYFVYLVYFVSFAYFAVLGVRIAKLASLEITRDLTPESFQRLYIAWTKTIKPLMMGVATSVIATLFTRVLGAA
jgi:hypothetical protein